jgi:biopolymer transport protein ExbD
MALSVSGNDLGPKRGRFRGHSSLSEINVTPFVDVLLVLLVIFMLTAHVMEFGIEIDVPKVRGEKTSAKEFPVVSIDKDGDLYLNEKAVNINELAAAIVKRYGKTPDVYLRADEQTVFGPIAQVMYELGEAKIKVNVVTKPDGGTGRRK